MNGTSTHITGPGAGEFFDVIIIGAGIGGINIAHTVATAAPSGTTYAVLEGRGRLGGTWDLFRYPGIRSDSDIYTFGYSWNPWKEDKPLAQGQQICAYLSESAAKYGIDKHIRFNHHVDSAAWSSKTSTWTLKTVVEGREQKLFQARFIVLGTGYYDYNKVLEAKIPGLANFQGPVIQPQFWPEDLDYANKNVVVIGSGATAITLVPNMAADAKHVTMLQRSPTYIKSLSMERDTLEKIIHNLLPSLISSYLARVRHLFMGYFAYWYCKTFPDTIRRLLCKESADQLPSNIPVDPHFTPRYKPWEQRLCVCPDGDFYAALRSTKASVVTETIKEVTEDEIVLNSGKTLHPDIIVSATGLKLNFAGSIFLSVDGVPVNFSDRFAWKGSMIQDVPNLAFILGYANASWTLSAETTGILLGRLWRRMKATGATVVTPRLKNPENMKPKPMINLTSTYLHTAHSVFPKGGSSGQWQAKTNHYVDYARLKWGNLTGDLEIR